MSTLLASVVVLCISSVSSLIPFLLSSPVFVSSFLPLPLFPFICAVVKLLRGEVLTLRIQAEALPFQIL